MSPHFGQVIQCSAGLADRPLGRRLTGQAQTRRRQGPQPPPIDRFPACRAYPIDARREPAKRLADLSDLLLHARPVQCPRLPVLRGQGRVREIPAGRPWSRLALDPIELPEPLLGEVQMGAEVALESGEGHHRAGFCESAAPVG